MPVLPGESQPLALTAGCVKKKGKGRGEKGKGRGNVKGVQKGEPGTPIKSSRKRKGDSELLQLDLKRQQIQLRKSSEPRLGLVMFLCVLCQGCYSL